MPDFDLGVLGWNAALAEHLAAEQHDPGLVPGRVTAAHRAAYDVQTEHELVRTRLPGRLLHENADVAVGDWVGLGEGLIRTVLPRSSALVRNAAGRATMAQTLAANIDIAFVVSSLGPELEPRRIERYLVTIWESGATPEIVLTKSDRLDDPGPMVAEVEAVALGVPVHVVSSVTGQGLDELRARIQPATTAVLVGSSGVGKSTLVNRFVGHEQMAGLNFMHGVAQAWEAGKLFHIDLNDQAPGRYDQDLRFGSCNPKSAFWLVKFLEDVAYNGPRHFDAHAYRTEDYDGVKDFARGCMRTYLILKEKAARWNADGEMQAILKEISAALPGTPKAGRYSAKGSTALLSHVFDKDAIMRKRLPYEKLDQLTIDILLGVR